MNNEVFSTYLSIGKKTATSIRFILSSDISTQDKHYLHLQRLCFTYNSQGYNKARQSINKNETIIITAQITKLFEHILMI